MTPQTDSILLSGDDVIGLLSLQECIAAVEEAFRRHGLGLLPQPQVLGMHTAEGGFHIKAALADLPAPYFAAKLNGNFFHNCERFAMPNIQGLILLADARNGYPLAVMDSIEITVLRTGAATAVAAKFLARAGSQVATICGCGNQGRVQLRALATVFPLRRAHAFDVNQEQTRRFADELSHELGIEIEPVTDLAAAARGSDICVTCTPAKKFFLHKHHVSPGTFVAGVGADNEDKQELDPRLLAASMVVADIREQCARIGDLHHAIADGLMRLSDVHAELGEIVAGRKPGRSSDDEITVFDSTGTALEDVAAAAVVYERAVKQGRGRRFQFQRR
ncbi:MAG TPA: ornithine cyclodeaminase family protein [Candidatus Angelobacter sp.]|nr:ornithine cyclodeaminase family protein [Candidatus Angelobacter sp.]